MIHKTRLTGVETASEGVIECYTVMFWCGSSCIDIFTQRNRKWELVFHLLYFYYWQFLFPTVSWKRVCGVGLIEFFAYMIQNCHMSDMANPRILQQQKNLPPMGLNLIITVLYQESNAYPTVLAWHVLVGGSLNWTFIHAMHNFTFWTWMVHLESIEYDYIRV